jgi:hypothetical protein
MPRGLNMVALMTSADAPRAIRDGGGTAVRTGGSIDVGDIHQGYWISEAEVTETEYTAFEHDKERAVTARLIVRRVRHRSKAPAELVQAEAWHRGHVVVEQVFAAPGGAARGGRRPRQRRRRRGGGLASR